MATVADKLLTAEEFGDLPDNGQPAELVRGRIVPLNMPRPRHGAICSNTDYLLRRHLEDHPTGRVMTNDTGVVTQRDPDTVRGADIAYYSFARVPPGPLPRTYLAVAPELVFEVRSPGDRWADVTTKTGEYLRCGVLAVCVLDEQTETAVLFTADGPPQTFTRDEEPSFPDILGDFRVPVHRFFE
jgi:Uma2 family endonuclease